jgi:hypothetical protein
MTDEREFAFCAAVMKHMSYEGKLLLKSNSFGHCFVCVMMSLLRCVCYVYKLFLVLFLRSIVHGTSSVLMSDSNTVMVKDLQQPVDVRMQMKH